MVETGKLSEINPETMELANTHSILSSMVIAKKDEMRSLQQAISVEQANLQRCRDDQVRMKAEQQGQFRVERETFNQELEEERLQQRQERKTLDARTQQVEALEKDAQRHVVKQQELEAWQKDLTQKSIEVQQLRVETTDQASSIGAKLHEAELMTVNAAEVQKQNDVEIRKLQSWQQSLETQQEEFEAKKVASESSLKNLESLRSELDPKLKELSEKQAKVDAETSRAESLLKEAAHKSVEVEQQRTDLAGLLQRLNAKEAVLMEYEIRLKGVKAEVDVKAKQLQEQGLSTTSTPSLPV